MILLPLSHFIPDEFTLPTRLDRTERGGQLIIVLTKEERTFKLLSNVSGKTEVIFADFDLRSEN